MSEQINQLKSERSDYVDRLNDLKKSIHKKLDDILNSPEVAECIDCRLNIEALTTRIEGLEEAHEHLTK